MRKIKRRKKEWLKMFEFQKSYLRLNIYLFIYFKQKKSILKHVFSSYRLVK